MRLKGQLAGLAALRANSVIHLAGSSVTAISLAGITAGLAALGLIGEALFCIELLLAGSENEFLSAFFTGQCLVSVHEIPLFPITNGFSPAPVWYRTI